MSYLRRVHWAVWLGGLFLLLTVGPIFLWSMSAARQRAAYQSLKASGLATDGTPWIPEEFLFAIFDTSYSGRFLGWIQTRLEKEDVLDRHWWFTVIVGQAVPDACSFTANPHKRLPHRRTGMRFLRRIHWAVWLGTLLTVLPLSGILLWGMAAARQRATYHALKHSTAAIELANGDSWIPEDFFFEDFGPSYPGRCLTWVQDLLRAEEVIDRHWWFTMTEADLDSPDLTDQALETLSGYPQLDTLNISGTRITSLQKLPHLPRLTSVELDAVPLTDEGLAALAQMKELRELWIWKIPLTGEGLRHLGGLPKLKSLNLSGTEVTDESLASLSHLASLELLDLSETKVTGRGLRYLRSLPHLYGVILHLAPVDQEGFKVMGAMKQVEYWGLSRIPLSSAELKTSLLSFENLPEINVDLTDEDAAELQKAFPKARIYDADGRRYPDMSTQ